MSNVNALTTRGPTIAMVVALGGRLSTLSLLSDTPLTLTPEFFSPDPNLKYKLKKISQSVATFTVFSISDTTLLFSEYFLSQPNKLLFIKPRPSKISMKSY